MTIHYSRILLGVILFVFSLSTLCQESGRSSSKDVNSVEDIIEEIDSYNRAGKGFQSIVDALKIDLPSFVTCKGVSTTHSIRKIRFKTRTLDDKSGRSAVLLHSYIRDYDESGEIKTVIKKTEILKTTKQEKGAAFKAFAQRVPEVISELCGYAPPKNQATFYIDLEELCKGILGKACYEKIPKLFNSRKVPPAIGVRG